MPTDTIAINSREQFQQSITALGTLHAELASKVDESANVLDTVKAAVTAGPTEGMVAPVYGQSVTAVSASLEGIGTQVSAAGTSVQAAMNDMAALLRGLTTIDDGAAADVKKA